MITLVHIEKNDASKLLEMQKTAFSRLLHKYRDYGTSPACESSDRIAEKITSSDFWYIKSDDITVGAVRIVNKGGSCRVSPVFILPEYRGHNYALKAMTIAETMYPNARKWELDTIMQEEYLVNIYKKAGYVLTGEQYDIKPGMTIVFMEKYI